MNIANCDPHLLLILSLTFQCKYILIITYQSYMCAKIELLNSFRIVENTVFFIVKVNCVG